MSRGRNDLTGELVGGRYRVLSVLREGTLVTEWLAVDERATQRQVVLVRPDETLVPGPREATAFLREMQRLAGIDHPRLAKLYDMGTHAGVPHAIVQHVDAGSLRALIVGTSLPHAPDQVTDWLGPIAAALDHIHASGIAHDELSPDTILFDSRGNGMLSDCRTRAAARMLPAAEEREPASSAAHFVAPERAAGHEPGVASDIFGLAAVACWALVGRDLGEGEPAPGELILLPPRARQVLAKAMSSDPSARPASCGELAAEWDAALDDEPPLAPPAPGPRSMAISPLAAAAAPEPDGRGLPVARPRISPQQLLQEASAQAPLMAPRPPGRLRRVLARLALSLLLVATIIGALGWMQRDRILAWRALSQQSEFRPLYVWPPRLERRQDGGVMEVVRVKGLRGEVFNPAVDIRDIDLAGAATEDEYCQLLGLRVASVHETGRVADGPVGPRCAVGEGPAVPEVVRDPGPIGGSPDLDPPPPPPDLLASVSPPEGSAAWPGLMVLTGETASLLDNLTANGVPCDLVGSRFACEIDFAPDADTRKIRFASRLPGGDEPGSEAKELVHEHELFVRVTDDAELKALQRAGLDEAGTLSSGAAILRRRKDGALVVPVELQGGSGARVLVDRSELTVAQFNAAATERRKKLIEGQDAEAALVDGAQADAHCKWAGGRLPTAEERDAAALGAASRDTRLLSASSAGVLGMAEAPAEWVLVGKGRQQSRRLVGPEGEVAEELGGVRCVQDAPVVVDVVALLADAAKHRERGRLSQAVAHYKQVLGVERENAEAKAGLEGIREEARMAARSADATRKWSDSLRNWGVVLAVAPEDAEAVAGQTNAKDAIALERKSGDFLKSIKERLELATPILDPSEKYRQLESILQDIGDPTSGLELSPELAEQQNRVTFEMDTIINDFRVRADEHCKKEEFDDAEQIYAGALELRADDPALTQKRRDCKGAQRKKEESAELMRQAAALEDRYKQGRGGDPDLLVQAVKLYREALQLYTRDAELKEGDIANIVAELRRVATDLDREGRYKKAEAAWKRVVEVDGSEPSKASLQAAKAQLDPPEQAYESMECPAPNTCSKRLRDGATMVRVNAKDALVGYNGRERDWPGEFVDVYILVDKREVTRHQYHAFARAFDLPMPGGPKANDDHPMADVSFAQAQQYCEWVGGRLPREHEWQVAGYGSRTSNRDYPWGSSWNASYVTSAESSASGPSRTAKAESASPYGCLHIAGNVAEWVEDSSHPYWSSPKGEHCVRGGSWRSHKDDLKWDRRRFASAPADDIGFRCVVDIQ